MYRSLTILFSLLHLSVFAADFQVEGLYPESDSEISRWGEKYSEIINNGIGDLSEYRGSECRVYIFINDSGDINSVKTRNTIDGNEKENLLCDEVSSRIKNIKRFPVPDDYNVRRQIKSIFIVIKPN
ncbi:cell envelope integrity protein TolA [Vibrio vulnificus]|uniref:cell envelope integrity protein TolA n=1 Tax=Vibrio vulnificus TaxID=672 RepID=UPI001A24CDBB|nr:cell envelope integrity protein TolA [Vibrio vulnificus]EHU9447784.1 cell envelope integrity protein TolA [Vibrio vulnificus]EID4335035.1 cell envelope integrity protein TolA [Vibrio vulnificus]EIJ0970923.1 cell envelope integrity protein TolA [Vibrio vulnificus]ELA3109665.1 cell envelope integrity protein TolA [Vibrio vulnificus]MDK2614955.1 cell envelope integrity protein TolA [Vibrio vulnificus]